MHKVLLPFLAFLSLWVYMAFKTDMNLSVNAIVGMLLLLSFYLQLLYFLGKRANTPIVGYFFELYFSLKKYLELDNGDLTDVQQHPNFYQLAVLLKQASETFGEDFFNKL